MEGKLQQEFCDGASSQPAIHKTDDS